MRPIHKSLKPLVQRFMPATYSFLQTRFGNSGSPERVEQRLIAHYGRKVQHGPFAGMRYVEQAVCSSYVPKLVGCYEAELHSVLEEAIAAHPETILDIGCAEGYYAVGLARRLPESKVYAFDIDPTARALCKEMAALNGVAERVIVEEVCDTETLRAMPLERAFLLCDCEGCELEILRPDIVHGLTAADILVELHDCFYPGLTPTLLPRFERAHTITLIDATERDPSFYSALDIIPTRDRLPALTELRPGPMQWAFMTARK